MALSSFQTFLLGMERLNKKLSHQQKGKERMKMLGNIQIPKEAFLNVLKNWRVLYFIGLL